MTFQFLNNIGERNKARLLFFAYFVLLLATEHHFSFMLFNLFLAYASLEICFLLPLFQAKKPSELPASLLVHALFLLMSPNVFYIVTDLIHLNAFPFRYTSGLQVKEWWHFMILVTGVLLPLFYYTLMVKQLRRLWLRSRWRRFAGPLMLAFIVLGSIGIYIGRFLRFHSVHFFTEPFELLERFVSSLNRDSLLFIGWMTLLQLLLVWVFAPRPADEGGKP